MPALTAPYVFSPERGLVRNGILVLNAEHEVIALLDPAIDTNLPEAEFFDGVLCPGFVNTHLHLELSHLHEAITPHTGFVGFAKELMAKRTTYSAEAVAAAMAAADAYMYENGVVAAGDISNTRDSFAQKKKSKIHWHTFIELLSLNPQRAPLVFDAGEQLLAETPQPATLVPHAPYSVSTELLQHIAADGDGTLSIHNQESAAENEFFEHGTGRVRELYAFLNIDLTWYQAPGCNALHYALPALKSPRKLLLVHNTFSSADDIRWAMQVQPNVYWCFCPKANLYIENTLPDFNLFYELNARITVGTDSLASNNSLSILDELKVIAQAAPEIPTTALLTWATQNGADALNMGDQFGSFEVGKKPGVNLLTGLDENLRMCAATHIRRIL